MKTIHMIGNAHIDPVWFWTWQDGYQEVKATFRSALDRMNENPDFKFTCACADYYRWVEENDPAMFEEIRTRIAEGRWGIVGGMWIQPDMNTPAGESLCRHLLYSQRYFMDRFGVTAKVGYNVDSFGHNAMLPQILKKSGIDAYVWMRPSAEENSRIPDGAMLWGGIDGTEIPTWRIPDGYGAFHNIPKKIGETFLFANKINLPAMCFYGVGNHGGGPTIENLREIDDYIANDIRGRDVTYASPNEYFVGLKNLHCALPQYQGELQHHASGCYSTHSASKKAHRTAESALLRVEKLASLSCMLTGHTPNAAFVQQAWRNLMFNEFHDIMGGCSAEDALETAVIQLNEAISIAQREENAALQKISWLVDTAKGLPPVRSKEEDWQLWGIRGQGTPVVVFNPHEFNACAPIHIRRPIRTVRDDDGNPVLTQIVRAGRTNGKDKWDSIFMADVPPLGYRLYWLFLEESDDPAPASHLSASAAHLENDFIRADFDPDTGALIRLINKTSGENVLRAPAAVRLMDVAHIDTWAHMQFTFDKPAGEFTLESIKLIESGPARASIRVVLRHGASRLEQTYSLCDNSDQLDMHCRMQLDEKYRMVKMCFPTIWQDGKEFSEIAFGAIERKACGEEEHCQRWIAMQGSTGALGIVNDGKYSYSAKDGELRMTVANTSIFADHYGQNDRDEFCRFMDQQEQTFTLALVPCAHNWERAHLHYRAALLNQPLPHVTETYHTGPLPAQLSALSFSDEAVQLAAFKRAEDDSGYVLRAVETAGKHCRASVSLPLRKKIVPIEFKPFEIVTYYIPDDDTRPCRPVSITEIE